MLNSFKTELSELVGLSKDALHVHLGLLIFLVAMVVFRRSAASFVPWLSVLLLQLANEVADALHWRNGALDFSVAGGVKDVINTMLWPTILLLLARFTPLLGRGRDSRPSTRAMVSGAPPDESTVPPGSA